MVGVGRGGLTERAGRGLQRHWVLGTLLVNAGLLFTADAVLVLVPPRYSPRFTGGTSCRS